MPRLAFLLRPGWLALALVVVAFTYLCFTVLAPWQLGKNAKTSRENQQIRYSLHHAQSGQHLHVRKVLSGCRHPAPLRVVEGDQAFEVLAPFVVDGGPTVLVDRGYVRPQVGSHVPPIPRLPVQTVTITARLRDSEPSVAGKDPFVRDGFQQVYSINTGQVAALTGVQLAGSYLQLIEDQPGGLGVLGVPHLDPGPFLSYGIQWISFGILAPIGLGYFAYAEIRARRREKAGSPPPDKPMTVEQKLADRYGRRR